MSKRIFYLVSDGGDGSAYVQFYESNEGLDELCEKDPGTYGLNEGGPGEFVVDGTVTGISFSTVADDEEFYL